MGIIAIASVLALFISGSASAVQPAAARLPTCAAAAQPSTILVLPEDIAPGQVAAGLGRNRQSALCTATPERLGLSAARHRPRAVVYLRPADELPRLPVQTQVVSYRPMAGSSRHIAVAGSERLMFYGRFLARSPAPLVVLTDRAVPNVHPKATVLPWQQLDLAALCASGSQVLALIAPIRIQQLAHRLGQPPPEGQKVRPCRSNWYFTSAARTQTTLGAVMKVVTKRQLRAYVLDAIGYYRKQPRLIAALGLRGLSEMPKPQRSAQIRSLYYVFKALDEAQQTGRSKAKRGGPGRMQKAYVFRVLGKGLVLDRTIR